MISRNPNMHQFTGHKVTRRAKILVVSLLEFCRNIYIDRKLFANWKKLSLINYNYQGVFTNQSVLQT